MNGGLTATTILCLRSLSRSAGRPGTEIFFCSPRLSPAPAKRPCRHRNVPATSAQQNDTTWQSRHGGAEHLLDLGKHTFNVLNAEPGVEQATAQRRVGQDDPT